MEITGLAEVPSAGDIFNAVEDERLAKELVEKRRTEAKEEVFKAYQKVDPRQPVQPDLRRGMKELPHCQAGRQGSGGHPRWSQVKSPT